jgi:hypothetical protein
LKKIHQLKFLNKHIIALIAVVLIFCTSNINWGGDKYKNIILSDGKGYYAYLPAVFIYHDLNLGFYDSIEKNYYYKNTYYDYRADDIQGHIIDKYYCGTAVLMLPFFLQAHALSHVLGLPADGYSKLYPIFINIAAIFYLIVGLFFLKRLLNFYTTNTSIVTFVLAAFAFGTNLFFYAITEPAMSHVYSFFSITAALYYFKRLTINFNSKHLYLFALFFGLTILIRPVNGLVLFALPFMCNKPRQLSDMITLLFKNIYQTILSVFIVFIIISIQLILYKLQTGKFFVDAYRYEHFNWLKPEFINILFSYKKGLFVYTPLIFLSLAGLIFLFKQNRYQLYTFTGFFILLTYVLSCWWCWFYGGSFGLRAYIEFYTLFAILMTMALANITNKLFKKLYYSLIVSTIIICLIQTYQYRYYQIHWAEMTKEKYWGVFLRVDKLGQ